MKIINFIVLLLVTNFISCTSNDSIDQTITEADLLGLWEVSELYTENGTTGIYFNSQSISGAYSAVGSDFDMTALFWKKIQITFILLGILLLTVLFHF